MQDRRGADNEIGKQQWIGGVSGQHKHSVSVVLVTFDSATVILDAVRSIDDAAEIIVVDNGSRDGIESIVANTNATLIQNSENLGFGVACNIGAEAANGEFVLFLNPDARLRPGAIDLLVQKALANPNMAALNPRFLNPCGRPFHRRRSRLLRRAANNRLKRPMLADCEVEMVSGAALLCRKEHFDAIGGFDDNIFLFFEDDDLALRLRNAGFALGYVHDAIVDHAGGGSTAGSPKLDEFKAYHMMKSGLYARRKHGVANSRAAQLVQCTVNYGFALATFDVAKKSKYKGYLKALLERPFMSQRGKDD